MKTFEVVYWNRTIEKSDRNGRNLSDGAVFNSEAVAKQYANRLRLRGGKVLAIRERNNARGWCETIEEYDRMATMSASEVVQIMNRK